MITCDHVDYFYSNNTQGLNDISINLPQGSRTVLVGANGAGKTTLLKLIAGNTRTSIGRLSVLNFDPFTEISPDVVYLGGEWCANPIVRQDITVRELLDSVKGFVAQKRVGILLKLMDVKLDWRMSRVSDGERRRVQLVLGLARPYRVLLIDEVTAELDVLMRYNFLNYLKEESIAQNSTVIYATHIFDGLASWPTHILHLTNGRVSHFESWDEEFQSQLAKRHSHNSILLELVLSWLMAEE